MNAQELEIFLEKNDHILCFDALEEELLCFRNEHLDWYLNNPERKTAITYNKVEELNEDQLIMAINKGLEVENITRITGYFTKVSSWNPGKRAELKDRKKFAIN
jgi:hypothetical protein